MATIIRVIPQELADMNNASISIMGDGFSKATAVYFVDSTSSTKIFARTFNIVSDRQINTVLPSLTPGRLQVFVITGGTEAEASQGSFLTPDGPANYIYYVPRTTVL
ncbi:IPT/TIG domain-containing protein [Pandoraea sputorum]|nr:IPT/TIG domain-containing protein [Pandoraea sputorum]